MRALLLSIALTIMSAAPVLAADLLILQSSRAPAYTEALAGFKAACTASSETYVLSDYAEVDVVRLVREERPRLVLAVGDPALTAARKIRSVPVVTILAFGLGLPRQPAANLGGITMAAAPAEYLNLFKSLGAKLIGVPYDPAKTGHYLSRALDEAGQLGLTLVPVAVHDPKDLQRQLATLPKNLDALWLLPDSTVVGSVNLEACHLFSLANNLPLVTFSQQHLKIGATASLDLDPADIGRQAAEMVSRQLNGDPPDRQPVSNPRKVSRHDNGVVLKKLGRTLR